MKMKLKRWEITLLLIVWIVVGALFVTAIIVFRGGQQTPPAAEPPSAPTLAPLYTPPPSEVTAKTLYPLAEEKAKGWREDARLVSARGTWEQTAINLVGQPVQW